MLKKWQNNCRNMKPVSYTQAGLLIDYDDQKLSQVLLEIIRVQYTKLKKDRPWAKRGLLIEKDFSVLQKIARQIDNRLVGSSFLETGYIFAPYIPMQIAPPIVNENDFTPREGIKSRYSNVQVNNNFYATIQLSGL